MAYARLRKVGGSVMLAIPPLILEQMRLQAESGVDISVDQAVGAFVVRPARPRYTLDELAAEHVARPSTEEDHAWLDDGPMGSEAI